MTSNRNNPPGGPGKPIDMRPANDGDDRLPATSDHQPDESDSADSAKTQASWRERIKQAGDFANKAAKATSEAAAEARERYREEAETRRAAEARRQEEAAREAAEAERLAAIQREEDTKQQRIQDIRKAMSRNISTGGSGTPYAVIDLIQGFASTGGTGTGAAARPGDAFEEVKDILWRQCKYLGGDAVLYCRFEWHKDIAHFKNQGAAVTNALINVVGAAARTNIQGTAAETRSETVVTLWGFGTVVKLLPNDQPAEPDDYAKWESKGLFDIETMVQE